MYSFFSWTNSTEFCSKQQEVQIGDPFLRFGVGKLQPVYNSSCYGDLPHIKVNMACSEDDIDIPIKCTSGSRVIPRKNNQSMI